MPLLATSSGWGIPHSLWVTERASDGVGVPGIEGLGFGDLCRALLPILGERTGGEDLGKLWCLEY